MCGFTESDGKIGVTMLGAQKIFPYWSGLPQHMHRGLVCGLGCWCLFRVFLLLRSPSAWKRGIFHRLDVLSRLLSVAKRQLGGVFPTPVPLNIKISKQAPLHFLHEEPPPPHHFLNSVLKLFDFFCVAYSPTGCDIPTGHILSYFSYKEVQLFNKRMALKSHRLSCHAFRSFTKYMNLLSLFKKTRWEKRHSLYILKLRIATFTPTATNANHSGGLKHLFFYTNLQTLIF